MKRLKIVHAHIPYHPVSFLVFFLFVACQQSTIGPVQVEAPLPCISICHINTDIISTEPPENHYQAESFNVLTFEIIPHGFETRAIEFIGKAFVRGNHATSSHSIHFRTDSLMNPQDTVCVHMNIYDRLVADQTYKLVRAKYVSDIAVGSDCQGVIDSVAITQAWCYNFSMDRNPGRIVSTVDM